LEYRQIDHPRTGGIPLNGLLSDISFVADTGSTKNTNVVLKINESGVGGGSSTRSSNMARFTNAALDLMAHLQSKQ